MHGTTVKAPTVNCRVDIREELHRELKHLAVDQGKSMQRLLLELIERAAAEALAAKK